MLCVRPCAGYHFLRISNSLFCLAISHSVQKVVTFQPLSRHSSCPSLSSHHAAAGEANALPSRFFQTEQEPIHHTMSPDISLPRAGKERGTVKFSPQHIDIWIPESDTDAVPITSFRIGNHRKLCSAYRFYAAHDSEPESIHCYEFNNQQHASDKRKGTAIEFGGFGNTIPRIGSNFLSANL